MRRLGLREWLAVGRVMAAGDLMRSSGPLQACAGFENDLARKTDAGHTLTVSSGTSALICALAAAGVGPGDEVLVPAYTWMATAAAPVLLGAVPVLVDINATLTMDPDDMARKITPRTRAVIPVHMLNRPCDMDRILPLARAHGLIVIEDACQAVGIRHHGRHCGAIGDLGTFSFNQYKNMTCGEGGAILTSDPTLFARARNMHDMGLEFRGDTGPAADPVFVGSNYKATEIQGAILRVQLMKLDGHLNRVRRRIGVITDIFRSAGLPVAPLSNGSEVASLVVTFDTETEASDFARHKAADRLYDNSKHVFTRWEAILNRRLHHDGLTPWDQAGAGGTDECPRTISLLKRSCKIAPMDRYPLPLVTRTARRMAETTGSDSFTEMAEA